MALDSGTTSNRCILFDQKGKICSCAQKEFTQFFPQPGWVEHDASEIWQTQLSVAREAMSKIDATFEDIAAIGITNQRETVIVWDRKTGQPISHAIVWQCRRTASYCEQLMEEGWTEKIREKTGLKIDAYFSATKIKWILDNVPGVRARAEKGELLAGTIDTWLIWKLSGGRCHFTDYTNASRTMLYQTAAYVDIYKALEDIERERKLTPEEKQELKKYSRLADAFTPLCKGMTSEYANQNAYDAVSVHGGSGFIMEYKCQRLMRDARIFSIYEGTTQLQVVAAIRYITNGTYVGVINDMLAGEVSEAMKPLKARVEKMFAIYQDAIEKVKATENQEINDFLARRLYDMTAGIVYSLLLIEDASKAPELFERSANVYVRMVEAEAAAHKQYIDNFVADAAAADTLASFRAE